MKRITANFLLVVGLLLGGLAPASETPKALDLSKIADSNSWRVTEATAEAVVVDGKTAAHLQATGDSANRSVGMALANETGFSIGTIDLDLKASSASRRCFLGVIFNVSDTKTFEAVYFRPFNFRTNEPYRLRALQYIAWPTHTWEELRKTAANQYEKPINPPPDPEQWFHARLEVTDTQVSVFVNHSAQACLTVNRLAQAATKRPVGLFVDSHDGFYANFKVKPSPPR